MSAICGIVHLRSEPIPANDLAPIMAQLEAYGKDDAGTWCEGSAALGHQMTYVTPESQTESLPWHDGSCNCTITAAARLDNRATLFAQLQIPKDRQASMPDSQLILQAYHKWGLDCPKHLLGDYAVAIWDQREQHLFCFRDLMGVRPFYYQTGQGRFIFASDIKAVLAAPGASRQLDLSYVKTYLQYPRFYHLERSFYQGLLKLPPAHALLVSNGTVRKWAYWQPEQVPKIHLKTEAAYIEQLLDIVQQSVDCRLRSAFPLGSHISGGLDSSGIVVLAARALRQQGRSLAAAFSWSPPPQPSDFPLQDERALAAAVCQQEQVPLHYTTITLTEQLANLQRDLATEPSATLLFEMAVCPQAATQGLRVLLSGWGGDELVTFNGRGYFSELFVQGRLWRLVQELYHRTQVSPVTIPGEFKRRVLLPLLPDWVLRALRPQLLLRQVSPLPPGLTPEFTAQLNQVSFVPMGTKRYERQGVHRNQIDLIRNGHLTHRLESWADHGSPYGIEHRYPLLDRRVVEFSLGAPSWLFFKQGWSRYGYRRAMEGQLPASSQWSNVKQEPALLRNFQQGLDSLQTIFREQLLETVRSQQPRLREQGYLDVADLEQLLTASHNLEIQQVHKLLQLTSFPANG